MGQINKVLDVVGGERRAEKKDLLGAESQKTESATSSSCGTESHRATQSSSASEGYFVNHCPYASTSIIGTVPLNCS